MDLLSERDKCIASILSEGCEPHRSNSVEFLEPIEVGLNSSCQLVKPYSITTRLSFSGTKPTIFNASVPLTHGYRRNTN